MDAANKRPPTPPALEPYKRKKPNSYVWNPSQLSGANINFSQVDHLIKQKKYFYDISTLNILSLVSGEQKNNNNNNQDSMLYENDDVSVKSINSSIHSISSLNKKTTFRDKEENVNNNNINTNNQFHEKRRKAEPLYSDDFALLKIFLNIRESKQKELELIKLKANGGVDSYYSDEDGMMSFEV